MSNRYISKPEIIEAIQYDGTNIKELKKLKGSTSISVHNNIPYLRMYNKQGELSYLEGIGKGDWLVRYDDGETLELFTDNEFKECFTKQKVSNYWEDIMKDAIIPSVKLKELKDNDLGMILMIDVDSIPEGANPKDYCERFINVADKDLPKGMKRINLSDNEQQKECNKQLKDLNNVNDNIGRWLEPTIINNEHLKRFKEQRDLNKRIQNYFQKEDTTPFTKFLQSLKKLIKEVEDDTSK